MQCSDIITAQILDILRLFLDLRMLPKKILLISFLRSNDSCDTQQMQCIFNTAAAFQNRLWTQDVAVKILHLQGQAVVCGGFVFAAVVLAIVDVNMVQLQEAHQISGCLQKDTRWWIAAAALCRIEKLCVVHNARIRWGVMTLLEARFF